MFQTNNQDSAQLVKHAITLLTKGTPEDWNKQYRTRSFHSDMVTRVQDAIQMQFDYKDRDKFYKCVNDRFVSNKPVDYLEFGVASGWSFKQWLKLNQCDESRFFGFDSFVGLPEDWTERTPKGSFDQNGKTPDVDDSRAQFIDGLFQNTLPKFLESFDVKNRLVIHFDADLYSSTLYAMMNLDKFITPGTIFMFDEFTARNLTDEYAALQDYCTCCYRDYKVLATRNDFAKLAVEIIPQGDQ